MRNRRAIPVHQRYPTSISRVGSPVLRLVSSSEGDLALKSDRGSKISPEFVLSADPLALRPYVGVTSLRPYWRAGGFRLVG
jgi:hypothetical protein